LNGEQEADESGAAEGDQVSDDEAPGRRMWVRPLAGMVRVRREETAAAAGVFCRPGLKLIQDVEAGEICCIDGVIEGRPEALSGMCDADSR
jgi:hypothetical protein